MQETEKRNNSKYTLGNQEQIAKALKEADKILKDANVQKQSKKSQVKQKKSIKNQKKQKSGKEMICTFLEAVLKM